MMIDQNEYHDQIFKTLAEIGRASPDIVRGYRTIGDAEKEADFPCQPANLFAGEPMC